MKLLSIALLTQLVFTSMSFAQIDIKKSVRSNYGGGNGGDADEIMIKSTLIQIGTFLDSSDGDALLGQDVDPKQFHRTVKEVNVRVVENELSDKFNLTRCALNFPEDQLIVFNRSCLNNLKNNLSNLYILLTHEVLNIMGLELPDEKGGSIYPISSKIGALGSLNLAKDCTVTVIEKDLYTGPRIVRSGLGTDNFSIRIKTEIDNKTRQALLNKGYSLRKDNSIGRYTLEVTTDHQLYSPSAWVKYNFTLFNNVDNSVTALGEGMARRFTFDFIAENTKAFRKINEKAYKGALEDFTNSLPACQR